MLITLMRAEGPTEQCGIKKEFGCFADANARLRSWANTAPENGGYDKCDFWIKDDSIGLDYQGRYDLKHWRCEVASLKGHVLDHLDFVSGHWTPPHMTAEQHEACIAHFSKADREGAWNMHQLLKDRR